MKTVDSSGVVVNEYEYDVYGTLRSSSGRQVNEFQFAGQQVDPTGLQYLRARYYDMETGRFMSRDPLASSPSWTGQGFSYGNARPATVIDPSGLDGDPFDDIRKLHPCNWGPVAGRVCKRGAQIVDSIGDGAIQLVKLNGEYALRAGANLVKFVQEDPGLARLILRTALTAATGACLSGVLSGPGCTATVLIWSIWLAWDLAAIADSEDDPITQFMRALISGVNAIPGGNIAKTVFDAMTGALKPRDAR
jgi:RHS repeat-associated protein